MDKVDEAIDKMPQLLLFLEQLFPAENDPSGAMANKIVACEAAICDLASAAGKEQESFAAAVQESILRYPLWGKSLTEVIQRKRQLQQQTQEASSAVN